MCGLTKDLKNAGHRQASHYIVRQGLQPSGFLIARTNFKKIVA